PGPGALRVAAARRAGGAARRRGGPRAALPRGRAVRSGRSGAADPGRTDALSEPLPVSAFRARRLDPLGRELPLSGLAERRVHVLVERFHHASRSVRRAIAGG